MYSYLIKYRARGARHWAPNKYISIYNLSVCIVKRSSRRTNRRVHKLRGERGLWYLEGGGGGGGGINPHNYRPQTTNPIFSWRDKKINDDYPGLYYQFWIFKETREKKFILVRYLLQNSLSLSLPLISILNIPRHRKMCTFLGAHSLSRDYLSILVAMLERNLRMVQK